MRPVSRKNRPVGLIIGRDRAPESTESAGTVAGRVRPLRHRCPRRRSSPSGSTSTRSGPRSSSPATTSRPGPRCRSSPRARASGCSTSCGGGWCRPGRRTSSIGDRMINARAETVATSNAYKRAFEAPALHRPRRRLLRVAEDRGHASRSSRGSSAAATASRSRSPGCGRSGTTRTIGDDAPRIAHVRDHHDRRRTSCSRPIHDRMPVVLPESEWDTWLDRENHDVDALQKLLVPAPADELEAWPVSTLVNKADNNGPELLDRVAGSVGLMELRASTVAAIRREGARARRGRARRGRRRARCRRVRSGRSPICSATSAGCTVGSPRSSSRPATDPTRALVGRRTAARRRRASTGSTRASTVARRRAAPRRAGDAERGRGRPTAPRGFWARRQAQRDRGAPLGRADSRPGDRSRSSASSRSTASTSSSTSSRSGRGVDAVRGDGRDDPPALHRRRRRVARAPRRRRRRRHARAREGRRRGARHGVGSAAVPLRPRRPSGASRCSATRRCSTRWRELVSW